MLESSISFFFFFLTHPGGQETEKRGKVLFLDLAFSNSVLLFENNRKPA
jgi:hypothetical protein